MNHALCCQWRYFSRSFTAFGNLARANVSKTFKMDIAVTADHGGTPVVMLGSTAVIEALLQAGADPNVPDPTCDLTVLHDAAREGFVDSVRVLVDHGADTNLVDKQGNLPLHLAAREGHLEVIRLLIGRTADPLKANGLGYTAGQLAVHHKRMDAAKYIEEYLSSR